MFDKSVGTELFARWSAWQRDAELHAGAYGDLSDPPGPDLAGALAMWEPSSRSDDELIERIGGWERMAAWAQAQQLAEIAELTDRRRHADELERAAHAARGGRGEPGQLMEFVVDEIALATRITRVAASHKLDLAQELTCRLPAVFAALQTGEIDLNRARIITDGTRELEPELRTAVADKVLAKAPMQTPSTLRAVVARAVHVIDPGGVNDRHAADMTRRRVTLTPVQNGMSELWALLPADGAAAIMANLHRLAEASHTPPDDDGKDHRSADQRRADALVDLATNYLDDHPGLHATNSGCGQLAPSQAATAATTGSPRRTRRAPAWAQVQVVLPANLVTGQGTEPAELLGYGPIPTSMAWRIAADATWQRLLTDPVSGVVTDVGRTRYAPPAALAEKIIVRDRHCRFPGCRQRRIDLDHVIPHPTGPTSEGNLVGLCRHHHRLKQHPKWRAQVKADFDADATLHWTTPTGHVHTTRPPLPVEPAEPAKPVEPEAPDPPPF